MSSATPETLEQLLEVQERDKSITTLHHQRDVLPERQKLTELEEESDRLHRRKELLSKELSTKEEDQQRLEDEVNAIEERVSEQEANLYNGEVTAIKDLQAIQSDIAGLQERKRLVEDQILEAMEQLEPLKVLWESILEEEQAISEQQNQTKTTLETNESKFDKQIEGTQKERSELAADIPEDLLQIYEKLRSRSGNIGVAQLTGRTCKGCHLDLPAVEVDRLKKLPPDELINCEECGCILLPHRR